MAELLARIAAIFGTTAGMTVLALAGLAFVGLLIAVFWDTIRLPRRDSAAGGSLDTAPPPLLAPEIVGRTGEGGWVDSVSPLARNAVLLLIGAGFMVGLVSIVKAPRVSQEIGPLALTQSFGAKGTGTEYDAVFDFSAISDDGQTSFFSSYCDEIGSVSDRYVSTCENGSSVRFDMLDLQVEKRPVVGAAWVKAAPTFVSAANQSTAFGLGKAVEFVAPRTINLDADHDYDAYLVVGVAEDGDEETANARARTLRDFVISKFVGRGGRADCTDNTRVFSATASFVPAGSTLNVASHSTSTAFASAAQKKLVALKEPAPMLVGITADPQSPTPIEDMRLAAEAFLVDHGADLQVTDIGRIDTMVACVRGAE